MPDCKITLDDEYIQRTASNESCVFLNAMLSLLLERQLRLLYKHSLRI